MGRYVPPQNFQKGKPRSPDAGRKKGVQNKTTTLLKEAILMAAEQVGADGKGKDGLVGYLKMLAMSEMTAFASLLGRVLPLQIAKVQDQPDADFGQELEKKMLLMAGRLPPLKPGDVILDLKPIKVNGDDRLH